MYHFKLSFLVLFTFLTSLSFSQTVRIVDNNYNAPTGDYIYSTLAAAATAADAGDTIYIQPSPTTYGNMTITKELHVRGIGFNLDKDLPHTSRMGILLFWNNTDNTTNSSNSTVSGVQLSYIRMGHGTGGTYVLDGAVIKNCIITDINYAITSDAFSNSTEVSITNLLIYGCDIRGPISLERNVGNLTDLSIIRNNLLRSGINFTTTTGTIDVTIANNIIYGRIQKQSVGDNLIIRNNNFLGAKGSGYAFVIKMMDAQIANNIFYGSTPSISAAGASTSSNFQRNDFANNLSYETGNDELPPAGGGVDNTGDGNWESESPLFANASVLSTWSADRDFTLTTGSKALLGGSDNTDIGISGGSYPFIEPNFTYITSPIPTIQILNTDAIINPGDNLDIRIKIKAN